MPYKKFRRFMIEMQQTFTHPDGFDLQRADMDIHATETPSAKSSPAAPSLCELMVFDYQASRRITASTELTLSC